MVHSNSSFDLEPNPLDAEGDFGGHIIVTRDAVLTEKVKEAAPTDET